MRALMAPVGRLLKLALAAKVLAENLSGEDRDRLIRALQAAGERLRPSKNVEDARPLKIVPSRHKGLFQVVMLQGMRKPFEAWVTGQGMRTYPLPGLDEDDLETLGVGPADVSSRRS
jgi:hypothetical protein